MAQPLEGEEVFTSALGDLMGGTPVLVYVKEGRIVRIRPFVFDVKVNPWKIRVGDLVFTPPVKMIPAPFELAYRRYVYNSKRIKYPMKRVDFNLKGERHPENRGKSDFEKISWDEALDIVAGELRRVKKTYGPSAIFYMHSSHYQKGSVHDFHDPLSQDMNLHPRLLSLFGGCTTMISNPDSWEGWYWGAEHVWGSPSSFWSFGLQEQSDLLEDVMQNSRMIVAWSVDMGSQSWGHGQDTAIWRIWLKQLGIKHICISPELNYAAGVYTDLWIPIRPGTDSALAAAIAYVWVTEGTYWKEYVYSHGYGFDKWKEYLLGIRDKKPKTPEWAEKVTGVKARITKALAREWASRPTTLCIRIGAACRVPYGTEWARMMVLLQAMQGIGRPGVNIWDTASGQPTDMSVHPFLEAPERVTSKPRIEAVAAKVPRNPIRQMIWRLFIADAILNPPIKWHSFGTQAGFDRLPVEQQFKEYTYPLPGHSEIRLIYRQGSAHFSTWSNTSRLIEAYQSPKIEFIVTQDVWMGGEASFSDILLPASSVLERNDICFLPPGRRNYAGVVLMKKCIEPLWDTKGDYEIMVMLARKLGVELEYTEGYGEEDWVKKLFANSQLSKCLSYEDFKSKGYHIYSFPDEWSRNTGIRWFNEKNEGEGLETPSGKIEFFSQRLDERYPNDVERPAVPEHIESEESLSSERAKKYPLLMESPHPRWRFHTQHAENPWLKEIPSYKSYRDGYYYEAMWINPKDAEARGIKHGDLVKIFNERAATLSAAYVTERIMPGVVRVPDGSWYDPFEPGRPDSLDRGGAVNLLTPIRTITKDAEGMVVNAFLVEVEKWRG